MVGGAQHRNHRRSSNKLCKINFSFAILAKLASLFAGFSAWQTNYAGQQYKPFATLHGPQTRFDQYCLNCCAASYCLCVCGCVPPFIERAHIFSHFYSFNLSHRTYWRCIIRKVLAGAGKRRALDGIFFVASDGFNLNEVHLKNVKKAEHERSRARAAAWPNGAKCLAGAKAATTKKIDDRDCIFEHRRKIEFKLCRARYARTPRICRKWGRLCDQLFYSCQKFRNLD